MAREVLAGAVLDLHEKVARPATPIKADGIHYSIGDDGAIHRDRPGDKDHLATTAFHSQRDGGKSWELRAQGTLPTRAISGPDWLQFSLTEYGEKRSKHSSACLTLEQVKRLRDLCNMVLGEAS